MNLLLDTNILLSLSRDYPLQLFNSLINTNNHSMYISVASIGEMRSIALQNGWGSRKWGIIDGVLS